MNDAKIKINTAELISRFDTRFTKAQKYLDSAVLQDSHDYVPMLTGNLASSGIRGTDIGSGKVVYNTPYAKRMYYGVNFNFNQNRENPAHPKACAQWFEKAKATKKDTWVNGVRKIIKSDLPL